MEWELKKRSEEKSELQKIITQLKTNLFDERQGKLTLSKEMEYLRKKQGDDGKKIKYLQSVCQPIEEQVILQKDQKPIVNHKFVKNELAGSSYNKENADRVPQPLSASGSNSQCQGRALVKTIQLPNAQMQDVEQDN